MGGVNATLLGVVANGVRTKGKQGHGYGYGYYGQESSPNVAVNAEELRSAT
jgi:hypothetical protein